MRAPAGAGSRLLALTRAGRRCAAVSTPSSISPAAFLPRPLSQEEGELTPTMKLKREKIEENFSEEIDALYDDED